MSRWLLILGLVVGCGESVVEPDPDDETETETETETEGDTRWVPSAFSVSAQFAVNPETRRLTTWKVEGAERGPYVAFRLYASAEDERFCDVFLFMDVPGAVELEAWAWEDATEEAGGQFMEHVGFMVPDAARVETQNCEELNRDVFGEPGQVVSSKLWGVGVGELRKDVNARFGTEITEGFWFDAHTDGTLLGGSWNSDVWEPAIWGSHIAVASGLDEQDELLLDDDGWPEDTLLRDDVLLVDAELPRAHYFLIGILAYDAETYLKK